MRNLKQKSLPVLAIIILPLLIFAMPSPVLGSDAVSKGAENFISGVANRGIEFLSNETLSQEKRQKSFRNLLNDSFDMQTIARFSIGRYWNQASEEQKKRYLELFTEMVVDVYSRRFDEYAGQMIEVSGSRATGASDILVQSKIISPSGPDVDVDWRVRYKDGRYKIIDVVIEGVSMAVTQRSDFASVIQRGGGRVEVLLAHLEK